MKPNLAESLVRLGSSLLLATWISAKTMIAEGQEYTPIDSITVHGVTFVGEMVSPSYSITDTVRARLVAANPTTEVIAWPATTVADAIHFVERWCSASLDSCTLPPNDPVDWGDEPYGVQLPPGRTILQTKTYSSLYPGGDWYLAYGTVRFTNPWDYPFPFSFYLRYTRQPTTVSKPSWTLMKARYR